MAEWAWRLAPNLSQQNSLCLIHPVFDFVLSAAVKFGDALSPPKCGALLEQLSRCQAPYQCAHGRPAQAPIVDLDKLAVVSLSFSGSYGHGKASVDIKIGNYNGYNI